MMRVTIACPVCSAPTYEASKRPSARSVERTRYCTGCAVVVTTLERVVGKVRNRKRYVLERSEGPFRVD